MCWPSIDLTRLKWFWEQVVLLLLGARWIGHGRAIESLFALVAATYGSVLMIDQRALAYSQATIDLVGVSYQAGYVLAGALLAKAALTGYGLIANIHGWRASRAVRFAGALLGSMIWFWYVSKFVLVGVPVNLGAIFAAWAFIYSIRIMALAIADLPRPGAPGTL